MKKLPVIERARAELKAGRPDRARDCLSGHLRALNQRGEYSQDAYLAMGEIYFAMKDFAKAGAAFLLTERSDTDAEFCFKAFFERHGSEDFKSILHALKPHAPSESYPPKVRERLSGWGYRYVAYRPRKEGGEEAQPEVKGLRPIEMGCLIFVVVVILIAGVYLMAIFGHRP